MFSSNNSQVSNDAVFVEDIFSTYLYTGNDSTQTINNGIDLAGKGGLVWFKGRNTAGTNNLFIDTVRGGDKEIYSNTTDAQSTWAGYDISSFNANGFSLQGDRYWNNRSGQTYASWTFRKQPKFFDVVTFTSNGSGGGTFNHSLGSTPGCVILKSTGVASSWLVYHRSTGVSKYLELQSTAAQATGTNWISVDSTSVTVGSGWLNANSSIVAYLFAHDAGGFGLTGTDNVISCGSYTGTGSVGPSVNLGYEPQWLLIKRATGTSAISGWYLLDNMRGIPLSGGSNYLRAETSDAETNNTYAYATPTATGFNVDPGSVGLTGVNYSGETYIYIAIRRGPMKVPTSGTSVFSAQTGTYSAGDSLSVGFPADMYIDAWRTGTLYKANYSRLVNFANSNSSASQNYLKTNTTDAEVTTSQAPSLYDLWNTTAKVGSWNQGVSEVWWMFKRAPSFFDEVCYTGTAPTAQNLTHNLQAVPEFIIIKRRDAVGSWFTGSMFTSTTVTRAVLNANNDQDLNSLYSGQSIWGGQPTSSVFSVGTGSSANASGGTYVAYLFATCAGVSKVGSYTGTGTTKQVDCGFTGGARFVLIKRTDSTGDWYVWDTARGIVSGNDPYLLLNSTAAETTGTDYIDTYSAGFEISSTAPAAINASGGTFIFLAIA